MLLTTEHKCDMIEMLKYTDAEAFFACRSRHIQMKEAPPITGPKRPAVCLSNDGKLMGGVVVSKSIALSQGKFAIIDDRDFEWLNQWKWYCHHGYAVRNNSRRYGKSKQIWMHRLILNPPIHMDSDHINNDRLDNRRCNLRVCTRTQNNANCRKRDNGSSKYKGVGWYKRYRKWHARIRINGTRKHLGYFDDEREAALVYNEAARKYFGEFARLNAI